MRIRDLRALGYDCVEKYHNVYTHKVTRVFVKNLSDNYTQTYIVICQYKITKYGVHTYKDITSQQDIDDLQIVYNNLKRDVEELK